MCVLMCIVSLRLPPYLAAYTCVDLSLVPLQHRVVLNYQIRRQSTSVGKSRAIQPGPNNNIGDLHQQQSRRRPRKAAICNIWKRKQSVKKHEAEKEV